MIYDRLRVFVSSRMQELAPERAAIRRALDDLHIDGWVFERDAGARAESIQHTYREELESADLYVGLFWLDYGEYTIDEFELATAAGKDRLIYEKRTDLEGRRDPRLQAFLDRIGDVESGLTPRWFNTPEELGEALKEDAARWQTGKIRALRELNHTQRSFPLETAEQRELSILLRKVTQFWVEGVLERSIVDHGTLELGRETQRDAVANPWEAVLELPFEGSRSIEPEKSICDVFEDVQGSLLVLGEPGSGKTTTMLLLLRELAARARRDALAPTPAVFNLSSWTDPGLPLSRWLEDELDAKYQIPRTLAKAWIEHNRLVLLLDGLDEVKAELRGACVGAINDFCRETGHPGIAVCCRAAQYEELPVKLSLNGAMLLRPLNDRQIDTFVRDAGAALAGLRAAIKHDEGLRELARSPLMLNLMCLAYRGDTAGELSVSAHPDQHARHLFATYIDRAFRRRGKAELAYPRDRTLRWMAWIARRLLRDSQSMFLIENLQPAWLPGAAQRAAYLVGSTLGLGLLVGAANSLYWSTTIFPGAQSSGPNVLLWLSAMPLWFLLFGCAESLRAGSGPAYLERVPAGWWRGAASAVLAATLLVPIVLAAKATDIGNAANVALEPWQQLAWAGVPMVLLLAMAGAGQSVFGRIRTVEGLGWAPANAGRGALLWLIAGAGVGGLSLLFAGDRCKSPDIDCNWVIVGFAVVGACLGGLLAGLSPRIHRGKTLPNQGMRLTAQSALKMGLHAIWLVILVVCFYVLSVGLAASVEEPGRLAHLVAGWLFAMFLALFLWFGGLEVLKHHVLRAVIAATGQGPWNLPRLLDHARDLNLMRRVGSGYIFLHRRLLEYVAAQGARHALEPEA